MTVKSHVNIKSNVNMTSYVNIKNTYEHESYVKTYKYTSI
jgi:hypothetical protein